MNREFLLVNREVDGFPEDYAASRLGLDNDGDDLYDELDPICLPEPGELILLAAGIGFVLIVDRRRKRGRAI